MERIYYSLKDYYTEKFHSRVYKITIDAGFSCPHREKDGQGCIYCDPDGSGTGLFKRNISIKDQIKEAKKNLSERFKAEKYFLYFQAFSNTNAPVKQLKKIYDQGLSYNGNDIVGLIIGTRPDCIDEEKLQLIASYTPKYEVWIEYGLQSMHKKTLDFINRGHDKQAYIQAINLTKKYPIKITTHIIIGLPFETRQDILETISFINKTNNINAIKIHSLYVPKDSKLADYYQKGQIKLMGIEEYIKITVDVLEHLPPNLIIARLTGETSKEKLIAPEWVLQKQKIIQGIKDELSKRNSYQGKLFSK